jgi:hypothetical protein
MRRTLDNVPEQTADLVALMPFARHIGTSGYHPQRRVRTPASAR